MPVSAASDPKQAIGRAPERLTLEERLALTGKFIALEVYTPETLPLRWTFRVEALDSKRVPEELRRPSGRP